MFVKEFRLFAVGKVLVSVLGKEGGGWVVFSRV